MAAWVLYDIIGGSLCTLVAACLTYGLRRQYFSPCLARCCQCLWRLSLSGAYTQDPLLDSSSTDSCRRGRAVIFLLGWPLLSALRRRPEFWAGTAVIPEGINGNGEAGNICSPDQRNDIRLSYSRTCL